MLSTFHQSLLGKNKHKQHARMCLFIYLVYFKKMRREDKRLKSSIAMVLPAHPIDSWIPCNELFRECAEVLLIVTIKRQLCFVMLAPLDSLLLRRC